MTNAASKAPASVTSRPELRSAKITGTVTAVQATPASPAGTTVVYTFDEARHVGHDRLDQPLPRLHGTRTEVAGGTVVSTSGNDVTVRFNDADHGHRGKRHHRGHGRLSAPSRTSRVRSNRRRRSPRYHRRRRHPPSRLASRTLLTFCRSATSGRPRRRQDGGRLHLRPACLRRQPGHLPVVLLKGANGVAGDNQINGDGPSAADTTTPSGGTIAGGNGTTTITVIFTNPDGRRRQHHRGDATDPVIAREHRGARKRCACNRKVGRRHGDRAG